MSRGIGKTQRAILDALANEHEFPTLTVMELAERIGVSDRQTRRAVRSLEDRALVCVSRGHTWHGTGEYGPLIERERAGLADDIPTAQTVDGTEYIYCGMPAVALDVWLPHNLVAFVDCRREFEAIRSAARVRANAEGRLFFTDEDREELKKCTWQSFARTYQHGSAITAPNPQLTADLLANCVDIVVSLG